MNQGQGWPKVGAARDGQAPTKGHGCPKAGACRDAQASAYRQGKPVWRTAIVAAVMISLSVSAFAEEGADRSAFQAALSLFYSGEYARARDAFEAVFAAYPGSPLSTKLSYWLGACSLTLGEYDKALGRFSTQIAMGGGFYSVHSRLLSGVALEALGRMEEAGAEYRQLLLDPASGPLAAEAVFRLAGTEYSRGRWALARDLYRRVLLDHPASGFVSDSLFFLAECERALGGTAEAEKRYRTLLSLYPGSPYTGKATLRIAEIAAGDGRGAEALELLAAPAARTGTPDMAASALRLTGDILSRGGDMRGAREAYTRALALPHDEAERQRTYASMADALSAGKGAVGASDKDVEEAAALFQNAARGPDRDIAEAAALKRAALLAGIGNEREAQAAVERFLIDFPLSAEREQALLLLARLSDRLGDVELAERSWDGLLSGYPLSQAVPEALYRRAMDCLALGREPAALEDLQRIGRDYPDSAYYLPSIYAVGSVYSDRGEYSRALVVFRSILRHDPPAEISARAVLAAGICRFDLGLYADALQDFDSLVGDDPAGLPAMYAARSLYRMNRLDDASARFRVLAAGDGDGALTAGDGTLSAVDVAAEGGDGALTAEACWWLGWCRYRLGDYEEARSAFQSVADRFPADPRVPESLLRAALCAVQLADDAGASSLLDRALALTPPGSALREEAFYQKGLTLYRLSRPGEGNEALRRLAAEFPGSPLAAEAFFTLASRALEQGDAEDALSGFLMVHSAFPASPLSEQAHYWAGEAALAAGRPKDAADLFWSVVLEHPRGAFLAPAVDGLERAVTRTGSVAAAQRYVEAARASSEISPETLSSLELAYAGLLLDEDPRGAAEVIDRVLSQKLPDGLLARALFLKGRRDSLTGNVSAARETFRLLASRGDRVGAEAMMAYARILEAGGQVRTAVDCYEAVFTRFPAFTDLAPEGLFNAARLAAEKGDPGRAGELSRRLSREYPRSPWVKWLEVESSAR